MPHPYPPLRFLSFASSNIKCALARLEKQVRDFELFDSVLLCDEYALEDAFRRRWADRMKPGVRGFGYWCWKPYLIRRELERLPEGGVLFYCDAGCHMNARGKERFLGYLAQLEALPEGVLGFAIEDEHKEARWTKGDVFDYFGCRDNPAVTQTAQVESGHIFLRRCPQAMEFVNAWYEALECDCSLFDDSPSRSPNLPGFQANRHDQSVFSVLYKMHGIPAIPAGHNYAEDWSTLADYPVLDMRDTGDHTKDLQRLRRWRRLARFSFGPFRRRYERKSADLLRRAPYLAEEIEQG